MLSLCPDGCLSLGKLNFSVLFFQKRQELNCRFSFSVISMSVHFSFTGRCNCYTAEIGSNCHKSVIVLSSIAQPFGQKDFLALFFRKIKDFSFYSVVSMLLFFSFTGRCNCYTAEIGSNSIEADKEGGCPIG